jgi:hypothetical protein
VTISGSLRKGQGQILRTSSALIPRVMEILCGGGVLGRPALEQHGLARQLGHLALTCPLTHCTHGSSADRSCSLTGAEAYQLSV